MDEILKVKERPSLRFGRPQESFGFHDFRSRATIERPRNKGGIDSATMLERSRHDELCSVNVNRWPMGTVR